jgi:hypothetical protein
MVCGEYKLACTISDKCFKEPTATVNTLSAGIARAAELQSVLDHLGKYSKFLQAFLALGLAASEVSVMMGVTSIHLNSF